MHLRNVGSRIAPKIPVMTMAIAVIEVTPPSISASATPIGVVTDFGMSERVVASERPNRWLNRITPADGYERADERAEQDGQQVMQQDVQLAVNRDGERHGRGRQEERNQLTRLLVGLVGRAAHDEQNADQNGRDKQRIADR